MVILCRGKAITNLKINSAIFFLSKTYNYITIIKLKEPITILSDRLFLSKGLEFLFRSLFVKLFTWEEDNV